MRRVASLPLALALAAGLAACPGDDEAARPEPATTPAPGQPGAPATPPIGEAAAELPPGVTPQMVAQGEQLYAGVCAACHGAAGVGTALGPALNDQDWIHITGEFDEIVNISRTGVPRAREYPAPMPPMGGGSFNDDQLRAIGAYVYSLSHGG